MIAEISGLKATERDAELIHRGSRVVSGRGNQRLSRKARQTLEQHRKRNELMISAVSIFDIATLERLGDNFSGDPADRLIAATAVLSGAPLVTYDEDS